MRLHNQPAVVCALIIFIALTLSLTECNAADKAYDLHIGGRPVLRFDVPTFGKKQAPKRRYPLEVQSVKSLANDNFPPIEGPFDNWVWDNEEHPGMVACDGLTVEMGTLYLAPEILKKVARYAKRKHLREFAVFCAPTRQSSDSPRCLSDFGEYKRVATGKIPTKRSYTSSAVPGKGVPIKLRQSLSEFGGVSGHNSAQCFVQCVGKQKSRVNPKASIAAFRLSMEFPAPSLIMGQDGLSEDGKAKFNPKLVTATLRSTTLRPNLFSSNIFAQMEDIPGYSDSVELNTYAEEVEKARDLGLLRRHSPIFDTLLGRPVGTIEGTRLSCDRFYRQNPPSPRVRAPNAYRTSFTPAPPGSRAVERCPLVLAHRAISGASVAESSVTSARTMSRMGGVDGVEIDVFLAGKGKELVVSHDWSLERVLGSSGKVEELFRGDGEAAVLLEKLTGCRVVTPLTTFLDIGLENPRFKYDLELKPGAPSGPFKNYRSSIGHELGKLLRTKKYRGMWEARDQIVISSFDPKKTESVNDGFPDVIRTARARHKGVIAWIAHALLNNRWMRDPKATAVVMHHSLITKDKVDALHAMGQSVGAYTIYDQTKSRKDKAHSTEEITRLFKAGVDWLESDDPVRLRTVLSEIDDQACPSLAQWMYQQIDPQAFRRGRLPDPNYAGKLEQASS